MRRAFGISIFGLACLLYAQVYAQGPARKLTVAQILNRLADQAEAFRRIAPTLLADETLTQRTRKADGAYETHEVVSVYGYGGLPDAPAAIHEIRKVVSVDGKQVISRAKARDAMAVGLHSKDDKVKMKLLEDFEKHGLHGAVTDFGQLILLFSSRRQKDFQFEQAGEDVIGLDRVLILNYKQTGGAGGLTIFRGNGEEKATLQGQLSIRQSDGLPMRISMTSTLPSKDQGETKDTLEIDYVDTGFGCIAPATVHHQEFVKDVLTSENSFQFGPFRKLEDSKK